MSNHNYFSHLSRFKYNIVHYSAKKQGHLFNGLSFQIPDAVVCKEKSLGGGRFTNLGICGLNRFFGLAHP